MVLKLLSACVTVSGLCVRHYRIANWIGRIMKVWKLQDFAMNLVTSVLRFGLPKTCYLSVLAHANMHAHHAVFWSMFTTY